MSRFITVAIHTYERAVSLRSVLENEGIEVELNNVNLEMPGLSSGVRVRIREEDLPLALRIIENAELFGVAANATGHSLSHTILVPVDLSENSFKAASVGICLAARHKASICLLYSYIDPYIAGNMQFTDSLTYEVGERGARAQMVENAENLVRNFADRLRTAMKRGELPAVKLRHKVVEGVPEDAIIECAKTEAPYIIIMGTRGADKKGKDMIGSVTAEVLDDGRFTVLTVPEPVEAETSLRPRNVLFFSNLDQDDILALDSLYRTFDDAEAHVTIVHVPKRKRFADNTAGKALDRLGEYCRKNFHHYHFKTVPLNGNVDLDEFTALQAEFAFDLIVVPNRRRNAFSRLINPGLAHKILFQTDIPMLVIPV